MTAEERPNSFDAERTAIISKFYQKYTEPNLLEMRFVYNSALSVTKNRKLHTNSIIPVYNMSHVKRHELYRRKAKQQTQCL